MTQPKRDPEDIFFCDFCGAEVAGDDVEFRLDLNDIFVFCPRCLQRARELEQQLGPPQASGTPVDPAGLSFDLPPELLEDE